MSSVAIPQSNLPTLQTNGPQCLVNKIWCYRPLHHQYICILFWSKKLLPKSFFSDRQFIQLYLKSAIYYAQSTRTALPNHAVHRSIASVDGSPKLNCHKQWTVEVYPAKIKRQNDIMRIRRVTATENGPCTIPRTLKPNIL